MGSPRDDIIVALLPLLTVMILRGFRFVFLLLALGNRAEGGPDFRLPCRRDIFKSRNTQQG